MSSTQRSFASDNYAPAHPAVLAALTAANVGHAGSYGADPWTERLQESVRHHFGSQATAYPVFNGTGANVVALTSMLPRWGAVVTSEHAHVHQDENGAPERVGGIKLLTVPAPDGKLTPGAIDRFVGDLGDQHRAQPLVVSITQATELGTVYSPDEIRAISDRAHAVGLRVHLDGARLANAAAALGVSLRETTTDVGVDVVSFGGTKNGLLFGEAVVVLDPEAVQGVDYVRKMTMQLASKMRFVSAQLTALLEDDLWRTSAAHANAMATRLRAALSPVPSEGEVPDGGTHAASSGLAFSQPTQANAVFAVLPRAAAEALREDFAFYDWATAAPDPVTGDERVEVRWMCSWDTTVEDVDAFAAAVRTALGTPERA
ncbi:threonine aldolase family protein [Oerskovia enterophila]